MTQACKQFNVGDVVSWRSQSQGHYLDKTGRVLLIIPAHTSAANVMQSAGLDPSDYVIRFDGQYRSCESFLVEAEGMPGGKSVLYWPRVSQLESAKEGHAVRDRSPKSVDGVCFKDARHGLWTGTFVDTDAPNGVHACRLLAMKIVHSISHDPRLPADGHVVRVKLIEVEDE